ncbi:MAG: hypothetical protein ACJA2S_001325 [Cyclobacteriaceae bacterium]|jgi:hypothetical protein
MIIQRLISFFENRLTSKIENRLSEKFNESKLLIGKSLSDQLKDAKSIHLAEFKVFSQWGDDGIIQYLIRKIPSIKRSFIEFGVENYKEANTRFLLMNNNWRGLVMDGDVENINSIVNDKIYWQHELMAKHAFVTAENVNKLISEENFKGEIGLLHIDIDGNDYWIWEALTVVHPQIVVMEYNSLLGDERSISIPYSPNFVRGEAHYSNLYAGASISALHHLALKKGYFFIGCNSAGNNAYFISNKYKDVFEEVSIKEGYVLSKFREARSETGALLLKSREESLALIKGLSVVNVTTGQNEKI